MKRIGIVGKVAAGKSFVAGHLARLAAVVLNADRVGHEVLRWPEVERAARERWGEQIFGPDGHIHRPALAQIVFGPAPDGPRELAALEQLTHPRIAEVLEQRIAALESRGDLAAIVLDAPVLFKAGWNRFCNTVILVEAPRETRLARALSRGWSQEDFARREAVQQLSDEQRELVDVVIDNSGSPEATRTQIEQVWPSLAGPFPSD